MKIFLAGTHGFKKDRFPVLQNAPYILESFYYFKEWQIDLMKKCKMFLLDSGAFTFMNKGTNRNLDEYLNEYIEFIKKNKIKYYFELDVDSVTGYEKVIAMRYKLESETGGECIPVWHKSRGLEEFIKMTKEYSYASIGGLVTGEIKANEYDYLPKLLEIAAENGCRIHGLGFTRTSQLHKYKFYSVDSSSWVQGMKYGSVVKFDGKSLVKIPTPKNKKTTNYIDVTNATLNEWFKFIDYAERKL